MRRRIPGSEKRLLKVLGKGRSLVVSDLDLTGIDLSCRAALGLEFRHCELIGANFSGADLSLARFIDCDLYLADFSESVLYTTWFYECNLTKANFWHAYLLGFRLRGTDVTKAVFDDVPLIGLERKSRDQPISSDLQAPILGTLPASAQEVELHHSGISMAGFNRTIAFLPSAEHAEPRANIRAAETAKYLRQVHADNGYDARAMHYYIIERRLRRHAMVGSFNARIRQALDYFFGEVIWRYGSSIIRPIAAIAILALVSTITSYLAPLASPAAGISPAGSATIYGFRGWDAKSLLNFLDVGYFYLTAPAGGSSATPVGWVKLVFIAYLLLALWLIALVFDAFIRKVGTSR
jgi:uncharacterized protein YjbI with pentapeptide repeats